MEQPEYDNLAADDKENRDPRFGRRTIVEKSMQIDQTNTEPFFDNRSLRKMIIPLFMEQLLLLLVGIVDTLVISYAGESAVFRRFPSQPI